MNSVKRPAVDAGVWGLLRLAMPLILASSGHAIRMLSDRIMLAHYSQDAIAAAMPAGLTCFTLMAFFIGTAGYVNTFVAQYTGAERPARVGLAVWQGLYLSLLGGILIALAGWAGPAIFAWMGHAASVQVEQVAYFKVLCWGSAPALMLSTLLTFWSGRGHTRTVMAIELTGAAANVVLNWFLIFGHGGCPRLGVVGAALATVISSLISLLIAAVLFLRPRERERFGTRPARTFDAELMRRLLRFGLPNGVQFMLDLAAFNLFIALLGRVGVVELEAANMAFSLNAVTFIPLFGLGVSVSILVGQGVGAGHLDQARRAVRSAVILALVYSAAMGALFLLATDWTLAPFARPNDPAQGAVMATAARAMRFIAAYLVFDALYIIYSHAIKGAGDTRFAMIMGLALSWGTLVLPCFVAVHLGCSVWTLWRLLVVHVMLAGVVFGLRYRAGHWSRMRVVEDGVVPGEPPGSGTALALDRG
ncbi:MAG: MATE family efflux transporter [Lentisphaerae bacterium]|nr:MATE family efflux transporter [Lentisphaerota bacterium]